MIENNSNRDAIFQMKIHFNLKDIGGSRCQIWLTATIEGTRVRVYTGQLIERALWLKGHGSEGERCIEDGVGAVQLRTCKKVNKELKKILKYCKEYSDIVSRNDLTNNPYMHSAEFFHQFLNEKIRGKETIAMRHPLDYINLYLERKKGHVNKTTGRQLSKGTLYNHYHALKRLQDYCEEKRKTLSWDLFTSRFEEGFTAWMMSKNFTPNTIASQYSVMKVWLKEAESDGLVTDKAYKNYTTKARDVQNIYLTVEEIEKIYNIDFNSPEVKAQIDEDSHIEETRDLFVIACWTALRYGDWHDLSKAAFFDGKMSITAHKTNQQLLIPLHPMVKAIYAKYDGHLPRSVDKSRTIAQIKKCGMLAGIDTPTTIAKIKGGKTVVVTGPKYKFITNHTARRSCATNLYNMGVPSISIRKLTGHTSEENFIRYIKTDAEQHADIIAKAFEKSRI